MVKGRQTNESEGRRSRTRTENADGEAAWGRVTGRLFATARSNMSGPPQHEVRLSSFASMLPGDAETDVREPDEVSLVRELAVAPRVRC